MTPSIHTQHIHLQLSLPGGGLGLRHGFDVTLGEEDLSVNIAVG